MATRSTLLAGRDFSSFFCGRIEISAHPDIKGRLHILSGQTGEHSLFVADQIVDVNQGDRPEPVVLPHLDAMQAVTVRRLS